MVRFSVPLDEAQNEWVEERAEELNGSKAQVMSMLVDAAMQGDVRLADAIGGPQSRGQPDLDEKFESLETRLKELEAAVGDQKESTESRQRAPTPDDERSTDSITEPDNDDESGETEAIQAPPESISLSGAESKSGGPEPTDPNEPTATSDVPVIGEQDTEPSTTESTGDNQGLVDSVLSSDDPETNAVRSYIERNETELASPDEIAACWKLLQKRGTANPDAFKDRCYSGSKSDDDTLDTWWEEGVQPVLEELPGVEPPKEGGRLYRYHY